MAVNELKAARNLSLDPVVISWLTNKALIQTAADGRPVSVSEVANEIFKRAMQEDDVQEDVTRLRNFTKKKLLKQRS